MSSKVSIKKIDSYREDDVLRAVKACLEPFGGMAHFVAPGQRVLIKPNLLGTFTPDSAAVTHPAVTRAVALLAKQAGGIVFIGDSPGIGDYNAVLNKSGTRAVIDELELNVVDFMQSAEYRKEDNVAGKIMKLAAIIAQVDVIITVPKLKTHAQMNYTGALKNQFGLVPGLDKAKYHYKMKNRQWLAELIVDVNCIAKPALAVMDAIVGMEGPGPSGGNPRTVGAIIAGPDLTAVDAAACNIIDLNPFEVPIIAAAAKRGFGCADINNIELAGDDIADLRIPDFEKVAIFESPLRIVPLPGFAIDWLHKHWIPRPRIDLDKCVKCMKCRNVCPVEPPAINPDISPKADSERCIKCYCCHEFCPVKAIDLPETLLSRLNPEHLAPRISAFYYRIKSWFRKSR